LFGISIETSFRSYHQVTLPDGSKEPLHRHKWRVVVEAGSEELNKIGLVMDFRRLRRPVEDILEDLKGRKMEKLAYFENRSSSAENIARYIYEKVKPQLPKQVELQWVKVMEEPGCWARFGETGKKH